MPSNTVRGIRASVPSGSFIGRPLGNRNQRGAVQHIPISGVGSLITSLGGAMNSSGTNSTTSPVLVANLPAPLAGARAFVTNATSGTFGAAVVGGGAHVVPVYSDGAGWFVGQSVTLRTLGKMLRPPHIAKVMNMPSLGNTGNEIVAFGVTVSGLFDTFVTSFSHILGFIALLFGTLWYAVNLWDWYLLHRVVTTTRTETHSIAGIIPQTKTTTEVTTLSKAASPPDISITKD